MAIVLDEGGRSPKPTPMSGAIANARSALAENRNKNALGDLVSSAAPTISDAGNYANALRLHDDQGPVSTPTAPTIGAGYTASTNSYSPARFDVTFPEQPGTLETRYGEQASKQGRNLWGERYEEPFEWFGSERMGNVGNTETNDAYIRNAVDSGLLSLNDAYDIMHHDDFYALGSALGRTPGMVLGTDDDVSNDEMVGSPFVIDDGSTYDYDHMTSNWMTGTQYLRYADMGMGGRPTTEIDPRAVYNKAYEAHEYGYMPFTPTPLSLIEGAASNVALLPQRIGNSVGNAREAFLPDYTIRFGDTSISGRDFDRLVTPYIQQLRYYSQYDPESFLHAPTDGSSYTPHLVEWAVRDPSGMMTYHYGEVQSIRAIGGTTDAVITFGDGSTASTTYDPNNPDEIADRLSHDVRVVPLYEARGVVPDDLDALNDIEGIMQRAQASGDSPLNHAYVMYYPDLVLPDGSAVPYDYAYSIYHDQSPEDDQNDASDDDISYGFKSYGVGPVRVDNKPARFTDYDFITDKGPNWSADFGDAAVDFTAGSLPISLGPRATFGLWNPWVYAASSALPSLAGVNSQTYDNGSYLPIAGYYDADGNMRYGVTDRNGFYNDALSDETRLSHALGTALTPWTEEIAGNIGGSDRIGNWLGVSEEMMPENPTAGRLLLKAAWDPAGEGIEEIVGNHFDEATNYGLSGMWANPILDDDGNVMTDIVGHQYRDYSTPIIGTDTPGIGGLLGGSPGTGRIDNATNLVDAGNAFLGGALVSEVMGAPGLFRWWRDFNKAISLDKAERDSGTRLDPYVEPARPEELVRPSEEYLSSFDSVPTRYRNKTIPEEE